MRIGIPGLLNNQDFAHVVAHHLARLPGVRVSYANPITGQVLIYYDCEKTDLSSLLAWFYHVGHSRPDINQQINLSSASSLAGPAIPSQAGPVVLDIKKTVPWYALDATEAVARLGSCGTTGLSESEARRRLTVLGPNELIEGQRLTIMQIVVQSLKGFMTQLLLVAGGVSLLVGERVDAAVIVAIVLIQAVVEAIQGSRAEKSLASLKKLTVPTALVLRSGNLSPTPSPEIVPGDILHLNAGDVVPADALIIEAAGLSTNEACLTGESIPVMKDGQKGDINPNQHPIAITDQNNMLFSGTGITGGHASAVVVATGMETQMGKIAHLINDVKKEQTGFENHLDFVGRQITHLVVGSVSTIAVVSFLRGRPLFEILRSSISLAVGAVPEGLPAVVTVALTAGMQRMIKRNAVVRNMSAVETLGLTTVVCTDKTGTLTTNEMTAKELYIGGQYYLVTGDGYGSDGDIRSLNAKEPDDISYPLIKKTLKAAVLCNNAELKPNSQGKWESIGDPTEGALLAVANKADLCYRDLRRLYQRYHEIAFDANRRLMTVVCEDQDGGRVVYVKGAPDSVINCCTTMLDRNSPKTLDLKTRRQLQKTNEAMSSKGLRVLAVAYKTLALHTDFETANLESELVFCGLVGMADPIRAGVKEAIAKCHQAGIKVVMITGDHQKTAEAIARRIGILQAGGIAVTGPELDKLEDNEFAAKVQDITVFSRTAPDQKLRIVRALKNCGQTVAMTGDGVNDAPAIKEADIGIAMGLCGTDVARDVAGITLKDDNFVTIVNGIEEGRTVSANLSKSVRYILSGSLGQLLAVFCATISGLPTPMIPSQILWVNLVTESIPAMALTADPPGRAYMDSDPLKPSDRYFPDKGAAIIRKGVLTGLTGFGLYAVGLLWGGWTLGKARTMAFSQLVVNRVVSLLFEREQKQKDACIGSKNPLILPAATLSVTALAITMYLPFMQPLFATVPISITDWLILITNSLVAGKMDLMLSAGNNEQRTQRQSKMVPLQTDSNE